MWWSSTFLNSLFDSGESLLGWLSLIGLRIFPAILFFRVITHLVKCEIGMDFHPMWVRLPLLWYFNMYNNYVIIIIHFTSELANWYATGFWCRRSTIKENAGSSPASEISPVAMTGTFKWDREGVGIVSVKKVRKKMQRVHCKPNSRRVCIVLRIYA